MPRSYIGVSLTVLLAAFCCCCSDGISHRQGVTYDNVITLAVHESTYFVPGGFEVGFEETVHDSRCPSRVYCLVPGEADLRMWFLGADRDTVKAVLRIVGRGDDTARVRIGSAEFQCYRIYLSELEPYPEEFNSIHPDEYVATIEIEATPVETCTREIVITDLRPSSILLDPYWIDTATVRDNILTLMVRYGGGCGEHAFELYMTPAAFLESYPVQANLYLRHDAKDDRCEALIHEKRNFDLTPLDDFYRRNPPSIEPCIQLNIYEYTRNEYRLSQRVLYCVRMSF